MDRTIDTFLLIVGIVVWGVRKYGIAALATRKLAQHAAVGRAKVSWFWNTPVRDHSGLAYSASDLVARLKAERAAVQLSAPGIPYSLAS